MLYSKLLIVLLSEIVARDMDSTQGRIATYLLTHLDEVKQDSIRELAAKMHESASSISRFCRDIGLQDFNELKALMAETPLQFEICSDAANHEQQKNDYVDTIQDSLECVRKSLDMKMVYKLAADIRRYKRVAIFGLLKAEVAAMDLHTNLAMQGKHTTVKIRFAQQVEYLSKADENDLIIIFSLNYTDVLYDYGLPSEFRQNRKKCPKVYAVTSATNSKQPEFFDEVIWFESPQNQISHPFQLESVSSLIAQSYAHLLREEQQKLDDSMGE